MGRVMGYEGKAFIGLAGQAAVNGNMYPFGVKEYDINVKGDRVETGDSRAGIYKDHRCGRISFEATLQCYLDTLIWLQNPATYSLAMAYFAKGNFIDLVVWTKGSQNANQNDPAYGIGGKGVYSAVQSAGAALSTTPAGANSPGKGFMVDDMSPKGSNDKPWEFTLKGAAAGYFTEPGD